MKNPVDDSMNVCDSMRVRYSKGLLSRHMIERRSNLLPTRSRASNGGVLDTNPTGAGGSFSIIPHTPNDIATPDRAAIPMCDVSGQCLRGFDNPERHGKRSVERLAGYRCDTKAGDDKRNASWRVVIHHAGKAGRRQVQAKYWTEGQTAARRGHYQAESLALSQRANFKTVTTVRKRGDL